MTTQAAETFTDVAAFLAAKGFRCELLAATITPEQCEFNRKRLGFELYPCPRCTQVKPQTAATAKKRGKKKLTPWQRLEDRSRQRDGKEKPMDSLRHGATLCDADLVEPREIPRPAPTVEADIQEEKPMTKQAPRCTFPGCTKGRVAKHASMCIAHYRQTQQAVSGVAIPPPAAAMPETPLAPSKKPAKQDPAAVAKAGRRDPLPARPHL
jgi:hypothetical protein